MYYVLLVSPSLQNVSASSCYICYIFLDVYYTSKSISGVSRCVINPNMCYTSECEAQCGTPNSHYVIHLGIL